MNNATSAEERKSVPVENTQQNPIFDNRLWRTLMKVDILLWAIIFLFILFFAANAICTSAFGTSFVHFLHGTSMEPTMNEGTWVVSKRVPFDELKVGDIITFRERKDATISITGEWKSNLTPVWMDGETVAEEAEKETPEPEETEEPTAKPIEYTDDTIMHRIIKIDEEGIHTQGDNNPAPDHFPVVESGYVSKTIFYVKHLAWPLIWMKEHYWWVIVAAGLLGMTLMMILIFHEEPKEVKAGD